MPEGGKEVRVMCAHEKTKDTTSLKIESRSRNPACPWERLRGLGGRVL